MLRLNQIWFPSFGDWLLLERLRPSLKVILPPVGTQQFTEHSISNDTYLAEALRLGCLYQIDLEVFNAVF